MRDTETIETAIHAAETGHLVFSTMHTVDAKETINRIMAGFPSERQDQARYLVSSVLRGVISMRLVERKRGKARVPACEVMVVTPRIRDLLRDPKGIDIIPQAIEEGKTLYGMQTFDQSLYTLVKDGLIDYAEAKKNASNPSDFELKFKGIA
jgi:twitching motility protein PilT